MPTATKTYQTRWWQRLDDDKVLCTLCPRECHIPNNSRGFCFVRANVDGELVLTTYGRSSGFCIDPIEKKPLNHFLPGTPILSLGTAGCNLGCKFCQNWDISKSRQMDTVAGQAGPDAIVQAARQTQCRSIAFTYNDPIIWAEYAIDTAIAAHEHDLKTVAVTAGYISPDARTEFFSHMDAANVDLKAFTDTFYRKLTQTSLAPVLDTLKYLKHETDCWFEITNLIIPRENDDADELKRMCAWIVEELGPDVPVHFSAFHPDFKMLDYPRTPHETLIQARQIAIDTGIQYAYVGNVNDHANQSTYCHACGKRVIERDWYQLGSYQLKGSICNHCNTVIPGVFDISGPGDWGRKRQPIAINDSRQFINRSAFTQLSVNGGETKLMADSHESKPMIDFDTDQKTALLNFVRSHVYAAVTGNQTRVLTLPDDLANAPAFGCFVTLQMDDKLRACRGRWNQAQEISTDPLGELLAGVARDSALQDFRFPVISKNELDRLSLDISIMHSPAMLQQQGEALVDAVEVGKHGLVMMHPQGRGLLLPHVATEQGWDARTFLSQLCAKAGLRKNVWHEDDQTQIMTFQTTLLKQEPPVEPFLPGKISANAFDALLSLGRKVIHGDLSPTELPNGLTKTWADEMGVYLISNTHQSASALGANQSLAKLVTMACQSLAKSSTPSRFIQRMVILYNGVRLSAMDYPNRHVNLTYNGVLAESPRGWALSLPSSNQRTDRVGQAMRDAGIDIKSWRVAHNQGHAKPRLTCFDLFVHDAIQKPAAIDTRPTAKSGQFYPASADQVHQQINEVFGKFENTDSTKVRAVMLPHAGWVYCQDVIAQTLGKVDVPDRVIIIGPKHTPHGAHWSVSNHVAWETPTGHVPVDTDAVSRLLELLPMLKCESQAHEQEHGIEVLLPWLQSKNANLKILPLVFGHSNFEQLEVLGESLAQLIDQLVGETLLVISSDMNHFEDTDTTQIKDTQAIDAMCSGDEQKLFETCLKNQISMCGMRPAVAVMNALKKSAPIAPQLIARSDSSSVSGDRTRVVGYAGVIIK
jgi:AmmeMemoRadiSam system radical SAM enzyme/AmmeMemoRadiSam system protein B/AmmeMemoRadiSam system protein A